MKRIVIAGLLILCGAVQASAETDIFKDVRSPHGHARSEAAKMGDARACGAINGEVSNARFPAAVQCMSSRGWAIARIERDPPPSVQQAGGGSEDAEAAAIYEEGLANEAAANDEAALAASQAATQMTNDGIAQTVQGINGP
jgi:hypothetical protein